MSNMMTVSSLNTKIKSLLEATFMHTLVEGEVASVTYHTSGHLYFSIKDNKSSIKCVMWRSSVAKMKFRIQKGMHIVVEGSVSVYTPRGEYQFQTVRIEPFGQGALALAYEQLKEKLKEKGYFDAQRKKLIPKHIQKIALVTAKDSAALHDMLKIIENRWAMVEVTIVDTLVQGEQAAPQIARALAYADSIGFDVVVVGRGGGSAEDLWAFNEEAVADAIYAMKTPVVSAVGHEVDVMISDFVADLRAATPSAAMEMILPDYKEVLYTLSDIEVRFAQSIEQKLYHLERTLKTMEEMLVRTSPSRLLEEVNSTVHFVKEEYKRIMTYKMEQYEVPLHTLHHSYCQSIALLWQKKEQQCALVEQKFALSNPALQTREGWAQISVNGKKVPLDSLVPKQTFTLQDAHQKVEALCINSQKH